MTKGTGPEDKGQLPLQQREGGSSKELFCSHMKTCLGRLWLYSSLALFSLNLWRWDARVRLSDDTNPSSSIVIFNKSMYHLVEHGDPSITSS